MPKLALFALFSTLVLLFSLPPRSAWADAKSCANAHASGQREVKAGHLRLATELFTNCGSDDSCPQEIRAECTEFLESVRRTLPTVIVSVVDEDGKDVSNVRVFSSNELLAEELDGRALELDPGRHRLRFVMPSGDVLRRDVLIREGEKNRLVEIRLNAPKPPTASEATRRENAGAPAESSSPPVAAYIASGVAVAGLGTFAGFALAGNAQKDALERCAPSCGESERERYEAMKRSFLIADVGLGVAGVSAVVATVLFLAGGGSENAEAPRAAGAKVTIRTSAHRASLAVSGRF